MASTSTRGLDNAYLSQRVKVCKYREMETAEDRNGIAKFLHERFLERYLEPLDHVGSGYESGFLMMASCCLLIEGLTAF